MKFPCLCWLGITVFVELLLPPFANPDRFLNINCGASKNGTDSKDDLLWVTDSSFINVKSREVFTFPNGSDYLPYQTITYFTDLSQKKYCYQLPVEPGFPYLVRTRFYERLSWQISLARMFDLFIGGANWTIVDLRNPDYNTTLFFKEIILAPKSDKLSLCLARNSLTQNDSYVFISTIELRRLEPFFYKREDDNSALVMLARRNFGGENIFYRRQELDPYDRLWFQSLPSNYAEALNASTYFESSLPNSVPRQVTDTAISARNASAIDFTNAFPTVRSGSYYFLCYFCQLKRTTVSSFQVTINNQSRQLTFDNYGDCNFTVHSPSFVDDTPLEVVLSPSNDLASKPFINGAELYKILKLQNTKQEDVHAIWEIAEDKAIRNIPDDWSGADPCLPSGYSSTGITCNKDDPPRVIIINLTNKSLSGSIPPSIASLTALKELLLGNNSLSGPIPDLSQLKNLTKLHLQSNNLTGTVPRGLLKPGLDLRVDPQNKCPARKGKSWPIGTLVGCSAPLLLVVIGTAFIWQHRHRSQPSSENYSTHMEEHASADQSKYGSLTEEDIKAATENYSEEIGKGSFRPVYRGKHKGSDVAVKVLSRDSNQGQPGFQNELALLSKIRHNNLVRLVGYCNQPALVALVYEYIENGSLKDRLSAKLVKPLDWHTRLNIALQAAEGLQYLHEYTPIIHRNIKCSTILFDKNMCAKLADFGISKVVDSSKSSMDYLDPEYSETSPLTKKSDVYSFGVVLLEIITGKSPRDGIVESARNGKVAVTDLIDPSLNGHYDLRDASRVVEIACRCTERKSIDRTEMKVVVEELQEAAKKDVNQS